MPQYPASTATKRIILFDTRGDSCADSGGSLWDLLASAGSVDPEGMTVVWVDGAAMRALPLGAAIAQTLDANEQARMVTTLRERAAGYTKLATMLAEVEVKPAPVEEPPVLELPAEAPTTPVEAVEDDAKSAMGV